MTNGILAWAGYVPRLRLERKSAADANSWANSSLASRGKGTRAFCNWDEDALTMGVEAGRACLAQTATQPERLVFASTTPPFADRPSAVIATAALKPHSRVRGLDQGGSQRAGSSALLDALDQRSSSLVIAADTRHGSPGTIQELAYGDGAAAVLVGSGDSVVARYLGGASNGADFVDHFRATGETRELHWEERWVRDEGIGKIVPAMIKSVLKQADVDVAAVQHFIFPTIMAKLADQIAAKLGITPTAVRDDLGASVGETGAAHSLLMLAATLDVAKTGEKILVVTWGHGCDVLLFETTEALTSKQSAATVAAQIARGSNECSYQKFLSFKGEVKIDFGLRFEAEVRTALTAQYRRSGEMAAFIAGKCPKCSSVQFPRAGVCVNAACDYIGEQAPLSLLGDKGHIVSFTADWLSFKGAPPFCFGLVQFESGARVLMEFADFSADQLQVGAPVRPVYRRKEVDTLRHYHSYFWKAAPAV